MVIKMYVVIVVEYDIVQIFVRFIVMVYRFKTEYSQCVPPNGIGIPKSVKTRWIGP